MVYHTTCPYCNSRIFNFKYINDLGTPQWAFWCDCSHGALMFNEVAAYEDYLLDREENQITNFDKYFGADVNYKDLCQDINEYCFKILADCEHCKWGEIGSLVGNTGWHDCGAFFRWLDEKGQG